MRKFLPVFLLISAPLWAEEPKSKSPSVPTPPPIAKRIPKELTTHGHTRIDPYFWLSEKENPEVIAYLKSERTHADNWMADTEELQETLFKEMKGRIQEEDESVPYLEADGHWYYHRFEPGKDYKITCRKKGTLEAEEQVIIDRNELAEGFDFFNLGEWMVTDDGNTLAYAVDTAGDRIHDVFFRDLTTGKLLPDKLSGISANIIWSADGKTLFYAEMEPETLRYYRIRRHKLGTEQEDDPIVYEEKDTTFGTWVSKTRSKEFIVIGTDSTLTSEARILPSASPEADLKIFEPRKRGHEYYIDHDGDSFFIYSNDSAKNFRLLRTPEDRTDRENWEEVIAGRDDVLLEDFDIFENHLVLEEREKGLTHIRILKRDEFPKPGEQPGGYRIPFNDPAYLAYVGYNPRVNRTTIRIGYTSMTTPSSVIQIDLNTFEQKVLKMQEIPGGFDPGEYKSERLFATAPDGVEVPISLVYRRDLDRTKPGPLYLTAYGAYGSSSDPTFSTNRLSLLDRGFTYAIAHVRGGEELGRKWYEDGRKLDKKNTFTDFIACSEHLIEKGFTSPDKLAIYGGSAGGLLVGAVINERPDLFEAVIADVPFVDVVTTMLDESIPLTTGEFDEWGDPKDKTYYDYMLSYSPYDNVKAQEYPALLVLTGFNDSQVQYFEPAKWVAKLRHEKKGDAPLLFKIEMDVGHAGKSGRFESLRELAYELAFVLKVLGVE